MKYRFKEKSAAVYVFRAIRDHYRARGEDITTIKLVDGKKTVLIHSDEIEEGIERIIKEIDAKVKRDPNP